MKILKGPNKQGLMKIRILLLVLAINAASCVDVEVCDESYESELVVRFKSLTDGEAADTTVSAFTLFGIRDGKTDSLLYDADALAGFVVPLDPNNEFSSYVMLINEQTDTLVVSYDHESYMISYSCGFANIFTLKDVETVSGIITGDSILNVMVDAEYEEDEEHIWLYL